MFHRDVAAASRVDGFACLSALLLVVPATVHAVSPEPGGLVQSEERVEQDSLDRRRVLELQDGRFLRVRSRFVDDCWERREKSQWVALEGTPVISARLERELIAEGRRRASAVGRNDLAGQVEVARWMVSSGLHPEALKLLDRVLSQESEQEAALALIAEMPIEIELAEEAQEGPARELHALLVKGAGGGPARREVAAQRIAAFERYTDLSQVVAAELHAPQPNRRDFAALLARRLLPGELLRELSQRSILDGMGHVREAALESLIASDDVAVLGPPINALASANANVRKNAIEALGTLAHPAAVEPLVNALSRAQSGAGAPSGTRASYFLGLQTAYVQDYDVEIAQAASIADPIVAVQSSGVIFDVRSAVQISREVELLTLVKTLQKLTGVRENRTPESWRKWWNKNQGEWRSRDWVEKRPKLGG